MGLSKEFIIAESDLTINSKREIYKGLTEVQRCIIRPLVDNFSDPIHINQLVDSNLNASPAGNIDELAKTFKLIEAGRNKDELKSRLGKLFLSKDLEADELYTETSNVWARLGYIRNNLKPMGYELSNIFQTGLYILSPEIPRDASLVRVVGYRDLPAWFENSQDDSELKNVFIEAFKVAQELKVERQNDNINRLVPKLGQMPFIMMSEVMRAKVSGEYISDIELCEMLYQGLDKPSSEIWDKYSGYPSFVKKELKTTKTRLLKFFSQNDLPLKISRSEGSTTIILK